VKIDIVADLARQQMERAEREENCPIPCEGYTIQTMDGTDYDCRYAHAGNVLCEECICTGGAKDPRTGKKFRARKAARKP
jgi:hypothetical protein